MEAFELTMGIDAIRMLSKSVKKHIEVWPGGDPDEQILLLELDTYFNKIILDATYDA